MAVEVHTTANRSDTHPAGTGINVDDGHLHVRQVSGGGGHKTVAIYAPQQWVSAKVVDTQGG